MAESRLSRPASFQCHFLSVGEFAPVEIAVTSLGGGKRAESLRVDVLQRRAAPAGGDGLDGGRRPARLRARVRGAAEGPGPGAAARLSASSTATTTTSGTRSGAASRAGRPAGARRPASREWPHLAALHRHATSAIAQADALRQLFWLDFPGWNATIAAHRLAVPLPHAEPRPHRAVPSLRSRGGLDAGRRRRAAGAATASLGCISRLWSEDGRLLASGTSKHVCRPNPRYEEDLARAKAEGLLPAGA